MKRPNILFAFADDWGRYASAYGPLDGKGSINHLLRTPNFDRVASEGVLFKNAYVPAPSCTPCRSSVLSGRYFWETGRGAILQCAVWDETIPTYPLELEKAGYFIGYTYKAWSPGTPVDAPYGGLAKRYQPAGGEFNQFSFRATEKAQTLGVEGAKQALLEEVRDNFDAFLADRPEDKPFCYWWGPMTTHRRWQKGSGKALWGMEPDDLTGKLPAFLPDVPEVREDVCDYFGECQAVDAGLGVLLARLEELGELDNTLIVVSGDHGIPGMPRGKCNLYDIGCQVALAARWPGNIPPARVVDDFVNIKDLAPTFLEAAGQPAPEGMSATSCLDVMTSEKAGQIDPTRTYVVTGRERHVADARADYLPYPQRAIRTEDYLYIRNFAPDRWPMGDPKGLDDPTAPAPPYRDLEETTFVCYADLDASPTKAWMIHHRAEEPLRELYQVGFGKYPAEELYDVRNDPDHLHNLVEDPAFAELRNDLAGRLRAEMQAYHDPRLAEHDCIFEHPPFTDPPPPRK